MLKKGGGGESFFTKNQRFTVQIFKQKSPTLIWNLSLNNNPKQKSSSSSKNPSPTLTTLTILNILITLTSTVFFYRELHALSSSPRFANTLNTIFATIVPLPLLLFYKRSAHPTIPKLHLFLLAVFNSAQNVLQNAGIDGINSGAYCVLLNQSVVPLTMIFSTILYQTKYTGFQYLGAVTVVRVVFHTLSAPSLNPSQNTHSNTGTWCDRFQRILLILILLSTRLCSWRDAFLRLR